MVILPDKLEKTAAFWLENQKNYIAGRAAAGTLSKQDAAWKNRQTEILYIGRMASFNRFYPDVVTPELPSHWADAYCRMLPERALTGAEEKANNLRYRITSTAIPFSQARIPSEERISWPGNYELIWALLSPERTVLDAIRLREAAFSTTTDDDMIEYYMSYFAFLEKYGYLEKVN